MATKIITFDYYKYAFSDTSSFIFGSSTSNTYQGQIYTLSGDDTVQLLDWGYVYLGDGDDYLTMGYSESYEEGTVYGGDGSDTIFGGINGDHIEGNGGSDSIEGGAGDDTLIGDCYVYDRWFCTGPDYDYYTDQEIGGVDTIKGGSGNDVIVGGLGADELWGGTGSDTFAYEHQEGFGDIIYDFEVGASGDQIFIDHLFLDAAILRDSFSDLIKFTQSGSDVIVQADLDGTDSTYGFVNVATLKNISVSSLSSSQFIGFTPDTISTFEYQKVVSFYSDNIVLGTTTTNTYQGQIYTLSGDDTVQLLDWGYVYLGDGDDYLTMGYSESYEEGTVYGGDGSDTIFGGINGDHIEGNGGSDSIEGGAGDDTLIGDCYVYDRWFCTGPDYDYYTDQEIGGVDTIKGGSGNDVIVGGLGADELWGGTGSDTFAYEHQEGFGDIIYDFEVGASGDQIFIDHLFSDAAILRDSFSDLIKFTQSGSDVIVQADLDGTDSTYGFVNVATLKNITASNISESQIVIGQSSTEASDESSGDTTPPTITLSSSSNTLGIEESASITFTLSESSTDFTASDVTVSGGTLSNFTGSGTSYTATFTPDKNSTIDGVISVASNKFTDAAGNANVDGADANNTVTLTVDTTSDTTPPTISIASSTSALGIGDTSTITFTLSESSTDFTSSDVNVSGGTLSNFIGSGTSYSATFTPLTNSTEDGIVSVSSNAFTDAAGNANADGADANNSISMTVDTLVTQTVQPDLTWTGASGHTYQLYKQLYTWDEASNFAQSIGGYLVKVDDYAENTELYSKLASSLTYNDLNTSYALDGGAAAYVWLGASDAASEGNWVWAYDSSTLSTTRAEWGEGNLGSEPDNSNGNQDYLAMGLENWPYGSSSGSGYGDAGEWNDIAGTNRLYFVVESIETTATDTTPPTVAITSSTSTLSVGDNATITFTLSESSEDFTASDVTVSGGTLTNFSGSGTSYTAIFTPSANSTTNGVVSVSSNTFTDAAGNANTDGSDTNNTVTLTIDTTTSANTDDVTPPTIPFGGKTFYKDTVVITFDENIVIDETKIHLYQVDSQYQVVGSDLFTSATVDGATLYVEPSSELDINEMYKIVFYEGAVKDLAGNDHNYNTNTGSTSYSYGYIEYVTNEYYQTNQTDPSDSTPPTIDYADSQFYLDGIVVEFDEEIKFGSGQISIFQVDQDSNPLSSDLISSVSIQGTTLTALIDGTFNTSLSYQIFFYEQSILDLAGNDLNYNLDTDTTYYSKGWNSYITNQTLNQSNISDTVAFSSDTSDYIWVKSQMTYADAQSYAESLGGNLVSINSATENALVYNQLIQDFDSQTSWETLGYAEDGGSSVYVWLGGNDISSEGTWVWETGDSFSYSNWGNAEPDDYNNQDTLAIGLEDWPYGWEYDMSTPYGYAGEWNDIDASNLLTFVVEIEKSTSSDTTSPTIAISSSTSALGLGETATITFTLSESSEDFTSSDVTVSGGTLTNFSGSGTSYTATFTPNTDSTTNGVISVSSSKFSDAAGNFNSDGSDANNSVSLTVDTTRNIDYTNPFEGQVYEWSSHKILLDNYTQPDSTIYKSLSENETGRVVSAADALAALKLAVGINPNSVGLDTSPYQFIAADVNQDGRVSAADALSILKMAVGLSGAPEREWLFVNENTDFYDEVEGKYSINRSDVDWETINNDVLGREYNDSLVAVLKGDVNGSWEGDASMESLSTDYFTALETAGIGPAEQWWVI
ncbi:Ig-like domain-containing protein [Marinobacterium sp. xm-a-127]|uniref:Ig-like domain-containing protein n=1 Tax=Marinobacterium sp. xm-a-127 TaxID=2497736 RepID=UPI001567C6BC|nr:Ig-like domain-containing protein [Marinobacterium sp. xm-a-127]NRP96471.1 Bifunctional hemolysin/adenylate cyclase precursor [Marinobacterium sp. xm-a-127]